MESRYRSTRRILRYGLNAETGGSAQLTRSRSQAIRMDETGTESDELMAK